MEKNKEIKRLQ
jgi:ribosome biogenesis protein MAK21